MHPQSPGPDSPAQFSDDAWIEVLSAVDRTYADLVSYQEQLERRNAELMEMRTFLTAILSSVSDVLIVADRAGRVARVSRSVEALTGTGEAALGGQPLVGLFASGAQEAVEAALAGVRDSRKGAQVEAELRTAGGVEPLDLSHFSSAAPTVMIPSVNLPVRFAITGPEVAT